MRVVPGFPANTLPFLWLETFWGYFVPPFQGGQIRFACEREFSFPQDRKHQAKGWGRLEILPCTCIHFLCTVASTPPPLHTMLALALRLGADKIARVYLLTLVWWIRSLSVSVVCFWFVVPCQTVCSECAFSVCGTNVTFVLVRVVDCFFCLSDWYSVVYLQSALACAIQKSSILLTLPVYSVCAFLSAPFRLFHRTSWCILFPRHACTFLVLGFRGAWVSHAPPRVPKQRRP